MANKARHAPTPAAQNFEPVVKTLPRGHFSEEIEGIVVTVVTSELVEETRNRK